MIEKKILQIGIILLIAPSLISCNTWFSSHQNPFSIEEINNKKPDKKVYIAGEVVRTIKLVKSGGYLLQDSTGKIWVVTSDRLPSIGDKISIKGTIQSRTLSLEKEEIYLQELEVKPYSEITKN